MKFAFASANWPDQDLPALAANAREFGYDGIDLSAAGLDAAAIAKACADAGIAVAAVGPTSIPTGAQRHSPADIAKLLDLAAAISCPIVRIPAPIVQRKQGRPAVAAEFAQWLVPLADAAAERKLTLAAENCGTFGAARPMWDLLELVCHPAVGVCWNLLHACQADDTPSLAIPTLGSRIRYVQIQDTLLAGGATAATNLGEGSLPVAETIRRLRGIGYGGWVTLAWEPAWAAAISDPADLHCQAISSLRELAKPPAPPAKKKEPAKE